MLRPHLTFILLAFNLLATAQEQVTLRVIHGNEAVPMAEIKSQKAKHLTDLDGYSTFQIETPSTVSVSALGYTTVRFHIESISEVQIVELEESRSELNQTVVTASRTHLDRRESTISVQVLGSELLQATQSISAAEGLSFRPGLRVEYNCQNCGFSQVRLNGLEGPYSQILIDGRPIFSALSGVYGLEQIPATMIERVEVVRGGGSSLYGANAIAGTINIITREPVNDEFNIKSQVTLNGFAEPDYSLQGNAAWVNEHNGFQLWASGRWREPLNVNPDDLYDRNGDGIAETNDDFSELTQLKSTAIGGRYWHRFATNKRLEVEVRGLYEFRRGGNRFEYQPHEADIAEQLIHKTGGVNAQYEWMSPDGNSRLSVYGATAYTDRQSYYGAGGNSPDSTTRANAANYYGQTADIIANAGILYGYQIGLRNAVLIGIDAQYNRVNDEMLGYGRSINQEVTTSAAYAQWRWNINEKWTSELGARYDQPRVISSNSYAGDIAQSSNQSFHTVNPRYSLLYKITQNTRVRGSFATGFRAPQAFDEDLHLSTLGGAARIVTLSPDLQVEKSISYNLGMEWENNLGKWKSRTSVDGFYTQLLNPFIDIPFTGYVVDGMDTIALLDTKVNANDGATVAGISIETEWTHPNWAIQAGYTVQTATYANSIEWYPGESSNRLLRAPSNYGYIIIGYYPSEHWRIDLSSTLTGEMLTPNERLQTLKTTPYFADVNASVQKSWHGNKAEYTIELGVYNLLNQYQSDIETGWERDASYFYGPIRPLSIYAGFTVSL